MRPADLRTVVRERVKCGPNNTDFITNCMFYSYCSYRLFPSVSSKSHFHRSEFNHCLRLSLLKLRVPDRQTTMQYHDSRIITIC